MTTQQALDEARRRWGPDAVLSNGDERIGRCLVGTFYGGRFRVKGIGESWEAAFEDADLHLAHARFLLPPSAVRLPAVVRPPRARGRRAKRRRRPSA
ncbi:MAG: hypothetical protein ACYDCL_12155 [Myxococcales bacterium]